MGPPFVSDSSHETAESGNLIDLPARHLFAQVADSGHNSGGGVVAAVTLAGAAASAELVLRLAARRKTLAPRREEIEGLLGAVVAHRVSFERAPDRDIAAFTQLVETQRLAKQVREHDPAAADRSLQTAYVQAAQVPLDLSSEALDFLRIVERALEVASRFTISDLGAAAALARGAIDAALLTVDANLAYVDDVEAGPLREEANAIRAQAGQITDRVMATAASVISGRGKGN